MTDTEQTRSLLALTAQIVSAHVQNNPVTQAELPGLIRQVHAALSRIDETEPVSEPEKVAEAPPEPVAEKPTPVVPPSKSVFHDYIICLEDGRKLKTLKRYLRSNFNLSPEQYRARWGLPTDYPMVAPAYAEKRSALAKELGLGRKRGSSKTTSSTTSKAEPQRDVEDAEEFDLTPPPSPPRRADHTAASVFSRFPAKTEEQEEPEPEATFTRKNTRKPFSKQLARTMRR